MHVLLEMYSVPVGASLIRISHVCTRARNECWSDGRSLLVLVGVPLHLLSGRAQTNNYRNRYRELVKLYLVRQWLE